MLLALICVSTLASRKCDLFALDLDVPPWLRNTLFGMKYVWKITVRKKNDGVLCCQTTTSVLGYVTGLRFLLTGISMFAVSRMAEKLAR